MFFLSFLLSSIDSAAAWLSSLALYGPKGIYSIHSCQGSREKLVQRVIYWQSRNVSSQRKMEIEEAVNMIGADVLIPAKVISHSKLRGIVRAIVQAISGA